MMPLTTHGHGLLKTKTLYVSDMDGTLLNRNAEVSARSKKILNEAIARGALFTVATARTPATVLTLMDGIDMRLPGVVMTGAALFSFTDHSFSRVCFFPQKDAERLIELYRRHAMPAFVYTLNNNKLDVYHIGELNSQETTFMTERSHSPLKVFHVPRHGNSELPHIMDRMVLLFSLQPWEQAHDLYQAVRSTDIGCTPLCYHDALGPEWGELEIFGPQTNKAAAVEAIASDVGAGRIVAFGDNVNDMPLFSLADEGIAVANAIPELKAVATDIIGPNDQDAVAEFIMKRVKNQ